MTPQFPTGRPAQTQRDWRAVPCLYLLPREESHLAFQSRFTRDASGTRWQQQQWFGIHLTMDLQAAFYYAGNDDDSTNLVLLAERCFCIFFPSYNESFRKRQGQNQLQARYRPKPNASHEVDLLGIVPPQAVIHVFRPSLKTSCLPIHPSQTT